MKRKQIIALAALIALALVFIGVFAATRPAVKAGAKTVTVDVVHADGKQNEFVYHTDLAYLGELLLSEGLVKGENREYGLYITQADGEDANYDTDKAYWALYENGEYATQGAETMPLADGSLFSLVYTTD